MFIAFSLAVVAYYFLAPSSVTKFLRKVRWGLVIGSLIVAVISISSIFISSHIAVLNKEEIIQLKKKVADNANKGQIVLNSKGEEIFIPNKAQPEK